MAQSGSGRFTVDPTALQETACQMVVIAANLDTARAVAKEADVGVFGSAKLAGATAAFVEHWKWQADKVGDHLMTASNALRTAAENYQAVEDAQLRAEGLI